jgi:hypothetical protein
VLAHECPANAESKTDKETGFTGNSSGVIAGFMTRYGQPVRGFSSEQVKALRRQVAHSDTEREGYVLTLDLVRLLTGWVR